MCVLQGEVVLRRRPAMFINHAQCQPQPVPTSASTHQSPPATSASTCPRYCCWITCAWNIDYLIGCTLGLLHYVYSCICWLQYLLVIAVHSLPVMANIQYKLRLLVHTIVVGHIPEYVADLLMPVADIPARLSLRTNLKVPRRCWCIGNNRC